MDKFLPTYISYGWVVKLAGTKSTNIIDKEFVFIGVDKRECINHALNEAERNGIAVDNIDIKPIDSCIVAIPAMMDLVPKDPIRKDQNGQAKQES